MNKPDFTLGEEIIDNDWTIDMERSVLSMDYS